MAPPREAPKSIQASSWSITTRITVYAVAVVCVMLIAVIAISHWRFAHYLRRDRLLFLADELRELRAAVKNGGSDAQKQIHAESIAHWFLPYYVRLLDEDKRLLTASPNAPDTLHDILFPEPIAVTEVLGPTTRHRMPDGRSLLTLAAWTETPDAGRQGLLQIALDITYDGEVLRYYRQVLMVVSLVGLGLFIGVAAWIVRYSVRPLHMITRMAQHMTAQHLDERIAPSRWPKELAALALAFDGMLDRLKEAVVRLQQFSADLAHELRTPIQNLMLETEVTLARVRTESEYQEGLTHNLEELRHLAVMVDDLLFLARADSPQWELGWQAFDAIDALQKAWDFFDAVAEEQGIAVAYQGSGTVQAEPQLLHRALTNLLSNALRHTPVGGTITLAAETDTLGTCAIRVSDTGCGIAPEHLSKLFDRFYQVEPDRPRSLAGVGLGLSIVKSIMDLHGGRVEVHSALSQGAAFTLYFPAQRMAMAKETPA